MNKKGSHVGMMLSFVIFITFIVFLYSILQPLLTMRQNKEFALESLKIELVNEIGAGTNYTRTSITTTNSDFVTELTGLATAYSNDYAGLKGDLEISEADEFGFVFEPEEGTTITAEKDIPPSVNIYAKKIPVYYVGDENSLLGFITLKIW